MSARRRAVVFGGAGFIGSHIVDRLVERGDDVVVVDGLVPETGGSLRHLDAVRSRIRLYDVTIDALDDLGHITSGAGLIVDCMAWTRHMAAAVAPLYDLRLNLESHVRLLAHLEPSRAQRTIYLGSRSQYGAVSGMEITEETPMVPLDVQSVHKAAADHHFRIEAARRGLNVASLRLPNCFGERQPTEGEDIGLVGGFIRALRAGQAVKVYGTGRRRSILYARDAAEMVVRIGDAPFEGFVPLNADGDDVEIRALAASLAAVIGSGSVEVEEMPEHVRQIDPPHRAVSCSRLRALIGEPVRTPLDVALRATVDYFGAARS